MKVTKFYGKVNDQEFNNVNDYNAAVTAAAANGSFEASSHTWVEYVDDEPKDQVKKVTKFEGRVNDQVFDNVQDYNKAITKAMNEDDLQHASSRTWVEEEVVGSTQELEEPLPQTDHEDHTEASLEYQLTDLFESFSHILDVDGITEENTKEFINRLNYFVKNSQQDPDFQKYISIIQEEADDLNRDLIQHNSTINRTESYIVQLDQKIKELQTQIEKYEHLRTQSAEAIETYKKDVTYDLWVDLQKQLQDIVNNNIQQNKENIERPKWMQPNYFNLLKEIFG